MEVRVDFVRFKELIQSLENSNNLIRIRLAGKRWNELSQVMLVAENSVILRYGDGQKMIVLLTDVVEFALDQPHLDYRSDIPYQLEA